MDVKDIRNMEFDSVVVNHARVTFDAKSENEGFARMVVMGFMMEMNPTMDELQDVKTAVSEAVTNAIIHGYESDSNAQVEMKCLREGQKLTVVIEDQGIGIQDVEEARQFIDMGIDTILTNDYLKISNALRPCRKKK